MLEVQLPAGDAELAEQRDRKAAAVRRQLTKVETAQNGLLTQAERLGDDTRPAAQAMRDRIYAQYTQRHDQHTTLTAELEALTTPGPGDPNGEAIDQNQPGGSPAFLAGNRYFLTKRL